MSNLITIAPITENKYLDPQVIEVVPTPDEEKGSYYSSSEKGRSSRSNSATSSEEDLLARFSEPPGSYESKHRWDPKATWTEAEEAKVRRKLDWKVTAFACFTFAALQLDRGNITNALSDTFLKDLNMSTNDYNTGMTIFYVCFLFAELPSQLISKKLGSDVWIPIQITAWSIVSISQVGLTGRASFYATRALIGLIEGGFIADTILYLSYYFTAAELTMRLSFFWISLTLTQIVGSLLAAGLLELRGRGGLAGWRYLFMIEGLLTFAIGIWAFFYMPASPTQTITRWRKKSWFTEREEIIIVNKVLRDDPTKSSMHNRQGLSFRDVWAVLRDYDLWLLYLLGLITFIAPATINAYFSLALKQLGFTTFQNNLLQIPHYALFAINNLLLCYGSKKANERTLVASIGSWWQLIFLIVLIAIPDDTGKWTKWAILSLAIAYPYCHPILVSMNSMNAGSVQTRTVASSVYNMTVQAGSLISSNIYRTSDAPYYRRGNKVLLGIVIANIALFFITKAYFVSKNKRRAAIWDSWTTAEKETYLQTTTDKGNKRLNYRFLH